MKPSEMRAAAKNERLQMERLRKREMEAQLRMQKIKDEINIIRQKEAGEEAPPKGVSGEREQELVDEEYKDLKMGEDQGTGGSGR